MMMQKPFLLSLGFLLFSLISTDGHAQDEQFTALVRKFEQAGRDMPKEKIYLHTDKDFYLAGEIAWFKVYNVDAATLLPSALSRTAYVEIVDRAKNPVLQAKIELSDNGGSGSFYLPLSIKSDNYILRAYTNWMKNEGSSAFFEKSITIVNTIKPVEGQVKPDSIPVTCQFFPESGNLVGGLATRLAFHIVDGYGRGVDAQGIITSDAGDTVSRFSPARFGIGSFAFTPQPGRQYRSVIALPDGKTFSNSLPAVHDAGFIMNVTDNNDGRFKVRVQAKGKEAGVRGERVYLIAHTRQQVKVSEPGYINYETDLVFYIDKSKLGEGVSHLTLFNKDQQPVCERLVFKRPASAIKANVQSDKDTYDERQPVELSLALDGSRPGQTNYSLAVFQIDSLQSNDDNIESYVWLSSDLHGFVESPSYYFSAAADRDQAIDNLLMTHGWRRFRWDNLLNPTKSQALQFIPEYGGHLVTVKVTDVATGKPAAGVSCFLSYPTSPFGFSVAKTNEKGFAYFNARDYYGPGEIIVQPVSESVANYRIDILTPFSDEPFYGSLPLLALTKNDELKFTGKSIAMQAQNVYVPDSIRRFTPPAFSDTLPFFGHGEYTYTLDAYKRFTTMEEVLREYVTPVNVTLRNGKLYMSIYDEISKTVYHDQMLVLIDGVPLADPNKIFSYDPLKVKKLQVVPRRYLMGGMNFKGVASFETYQGRFDGFELTPGLIAVDYEGLQLQREFYSPSYATGDERLKRIPDMRSTLFWTTGVAAGNDKLQFYTSDQTGRFLVVLQGLTKDGRPVAATHSFTVK